MYSRGAGHAHVTAMLRSRDQLPLLETEGRNAIHKSKLAVNVMIAPDGTNSFCQLFRAFQRHWAAGTVVVLRYVSLPGYPLQTVRKPAPKTAHQLHQKI